MLAKGLGRMALVLGLVGLFVGGSLTAEEQKRKVLSPDTDKSIIKHLNPREVDPSLLPLDEIEDLNLTGRPVEVDIASWRLKIKGRSVRGQIEWDIAELRGMPREKRKVLLICPGFFADYAEWEGPSLNTILERAGAVKDYNGIKITGLDGYISDFERDEMERGFLMLALKVNGQWLPDEHGYPARLVAEDFFGGRWVKWISEIEVY
jgi:sulfoxide reductase catalytic subunit YedY